MQVYRFADKERTHALRGIHREVVRTETRDK